jgi:hypothetical protein
MVRLLFAVLAVLVVTNLLPIFGRVIAVIVSKAGGSELLELSFILYISPLLGW